MKSNKSMILVTSVLMTSFLFACGKNPAMNSASLQQPTQLVSLSVDPCPPGCDCRPQTKVQGSTGESADANDPVVNTPVVTKINTKTTDNSSTPKATETKPADDLISDTPLPEVSAPPASENKGTTDGSTTEKPKTKVGQLIDKIKNIFKKKS